jgi:hypothetical protein
MSVYLESILRYFTSDVASWRYFSALLFSSNLGSIYAEDIE